MENKKCQGEKSPNKEALRYVCQNGEEIVITEEEFKKACKLTLEGMLTLLGEDLDPEDEHEFSDDFKRKMNQLFRDCFGGNDIPHPEVDS